LTSHGCVRMAYCPRCQSEMAAAASLCRICGYDFPQPDPHARPGLFRWEGRASWGCLLLFIVLFVVSGSWTVEGAVVFSAVLGMGIGLGVSGCVRGSRESRMTSAAALVLNLSVAAVIAGAWLAVDR